MCRYSVFQSTPLELGDIGFPKKRFFLEISVNPMYYSFKSDSGAAGQPAESESPFFVEFQ